MRKRRNASLTRACQKVLADEFLGMHKSKKREFTASTGQRKKVCVRIRQVSLDHEDAVATCAVTGSGKGCVQCRHAVSAKRPAQPSVSLPPLTPAPPTQTARTSPALALDGLRVQ